jgi:hypothetical protein
VRLMVNSSATPLRDAARFSTAKKYTPSLILPAKY